MSRPQSRPEAELPEVTDEMVERAVEEIRKAKHTCWDRWTDHDAMRAAPQAAYGQQCAASRQAVEVPELLSLNDDQLAILDDEYGSEPGESGGAVPCQIGDYGAPEGIDFATVIFNDRKICECYSDDDAAIVSAALNFARDRRIHFATHLGGAGGDEGLRSTLNKVREFLTHKMWGNWNYMEGSEIYDDIQQNVALIDAALTPPAPGSEVRP